MEVAIAVRDTSVIPRTGTERGLGPLVKGLEKTTPFAEALAKLRQLAPMYASEFPGGRVQVKDDKLVMTDMAFTGSKIYLAGVERRGSTYKVVDYELGLPEY